MMWASVAIGEIEVPTRGGISSESAHNGASIGRYIMDLFEAMHTQRAIRRYEPDPVSDDDIAKILKATVHAPSGGNRQPWHFVVVRDAELRKKLGELYWGATEYARENLGLHKETPTYLHSGYDFAQHIGEFPVHILPFVQTAENPFFMGSNIYMAIQNLFLAARGLGLGTCYTSNILAREEQVKELLGVPDGWTLAALIPLGHLGPGEHFGGARRKPLEEVVSYDQWGQQPH